MSQFKEELEDGLDMALEVMNTGGGCKAFANIRNPNTPCILITNREGYSLPTNWDCTIGFYVDEDSIYYPQGFQKTKDVSSIVEMREFLAEMEKETGLKISSDV